MIAFANRPPKPLRSSAEAVLMSTCAGPNAANPTGSAAPRCPAGAEGDSERGPASPVFAAAGACDMFGSSVSRRGFEICIDGLSIWLMRIAREIGRGTSMQALRERRACQERADAHQAALPVQSLRPELH